MAGCGEDDVDRITARTLEGVALHQAVAFEVTDYRFRLRQPPALDNGADLAHQLRFQQLPFRIVEPRSANTLPLPTSNVMSLLMSSSASHDAHGTELRPLSAAL